MDTLGVVSIGLLLALNLSTFAIFGWDKYCAGKGRRRVSERTLLAFSALGGWPGAYLAMPVFRHKTRKRSFRWRLHLLAALWCLAAAAVVVWRVSRA